MKEHEIRPEKIFNEYLRLAKIDTEVYFGKSKSEPLPCPSCNKEGVFSFKKDHFDYCECKDCLNLFVSPRPIAEAFNSYYQNSPSVKYWATTFYKKTEKARREKIWKPKAKLIYKLLKSLNAGDYDIIDVGGGYGIFAEEMKKLTKSNLYIIEPGPELAKICREKGFIVYENFLENLHINDMPNSKKCFVSFELFEHLHSPEKFLENLNHLMNKDDIFIFSTLSSSGIDIQLLWEDSPSVSPPHHLNFFNPISIKTLLEKNGFKNVNVKTPGKLDIDIMFNNREKIKDRFWKTFFSLTNERVKSKWQQIITDTNLSSHMMVSCRK